MPLIDTKCSSESCGAISEVYRALADWPKTPPCPTCGSPTEQIMLPKAVQWSVDPVVIYQAPDGSFRFPGSTDSLSTSQYDRQGFKRIEARSAVEVRALEKRVEAHDASLMARRHEIQQEQRERMQKDNRSRLRDEMRGMSEFGRNVARVAMARNDAKPTKRPGSPGFHVEAYSQNSSNREASRGSDGRRRRD